MNTPELSTASAGEAFQWPKMPDLRYHGEYRRGYANCLDDVKRAFEAAPERAPLTDEQIESATGAKRGTPMWLVAVAFARAIEAAHGIAPAGGIGGE